MLDAAARAAGVRTGLYTSPHLERFAERFRVNGEPIGDDELLQLYRGLQERLPWAFEGPQSLTFFELVTLLGFLHFAHARVELLVVEVGLGGRLDATNVLTPAVACITPIGDDHREFLGDTLGEIAREKAGILKPGRPAVIARQPPEALEAILARASEVGAPVSLEGRDFGIEPGSHGLIYQSTPSKPVEVELGLRGMHQRSNAAVALRALELAQTEGIPIPPSAAVQGVATVWWPGRLETVGWNPEIILDGAHNPPGAEALASACRELFPQRRIHLVLGVLADKNLDAILRPLAPIATRIVATTPHSPRALAAEALAARVPPGAQVEVVPVPCEAVRHVRETCGDDDLVLVCGSLYLVGEVRSWLRGTTAGGPAEILR
jgi:dihydrofolate synthase/folylpolyglutamate synthase